MNTLFAVVWAAAGTASNGSDALITYGLFLLLLIGATTDLASGFHRLKRTLQQTKWDRVK